MNVLHPTNPANPATWILPVVCWFGLINAGVIVFGKMKRRRSIQRVEDLAASRADSSG
jgi:cytochrome c-type biogenesis protein CcmH/NrfF